MDFDILITLAKHLPVEIYTAVVVVITLITYVIKRRDTQVDQFTSVSKLQTDQLVILIEQNKQLAVELHAVRKELTDAYKVIDDMRQRVTELEELLKRKSSE